LNFFSETSKVFISRAKFALTTKQKKMKYRLTKGEYEALTPEQQALYTLTGEEAILTVDGLPDVGGIQKKLDIEKEHRKTAEKRLQETEARESKLKDDLANAGGNKAEIERLKAEHTAEIEKLRKEREAEQTKSKEERNRILVAEEATKFSNLHFIDSPFGNGFIKGEYSRRLKVEEVDGQPVIRVCNADGSPSTASLGDLQKEFLDNAAYKPIIKTKVGGGGGAVPGLGGGATSKKLSEMTASEEAAFERDFPEQYTAALKANK
jgi:hypothetical protein